MASDCKSPIRKRGKRGEKRKLGERRKEEERKKERRRRKGRRRSGVSEGVSGDRDRQIETDKEHYACNLSTS